MFDVQVQTTCWYALQEVRSCGSAHPDARSGATVLCSCSAALAPAQVPPVRLGPARGQAMQGGRGRTGYGAPGAYFGRGRGGMSAGGPGRGGRGAPSFAQRPMAMAGGYQAGRAGRGMMGRGGRGTAGRGAPFNAGPLPGDAPPRYFYIAVHPVLSG